MLVLPSFRLSSALVLLFLCLHAPRHVVADGSRVSGEFDCEAHNPRAGIENGASCLSRLEQFPEDYAACRTSVCYIFLQEPPFIHLDPLDFNDSAEAVDLQRPFECGKPESFHPSLGGIAFELHKATSSRDLLCMWGGHGSRCSFNDLVDYTEVMAEEGYQFAVTGLLLETPQRQCRHEASAPFLDNSMIIIGQRSDDKNSKQDALTQLTRPFHWSTWSLFGTVILLFIIVCFAIAWRFHVFRGRSLITAFFIFTGERDEALAYEAQMQKDHRDAPPDSLSQELTFGDSPDVAFTTKYGLSMTLFRISLLSFLGIFVLFYEVAVVNFLFQQQSLVISKSVRDLTISELSKYSVLKNSALENVWNATVNSVTNPKYDGANEDEIPWQRCDSATECIRWTAEGTRANFVVTFEVVGKFLIKEESSCEVLTIFETEDILYQFNAGWLYNDQVDPETRKQVDRELVALRINGTIRDLVEEEIGDFSCTNAFRPDIGPMIILVPCLIFVFPPLILSVLVLLLWKRKKKHDAVRAAKMAEEEKRKEKEEHEDEMDDVDDLPSALGVLDDLRNLGVTELNDDGGGMLGMEEGKLRQNDAVS